MEFLILGPLEARDGGRPVPLGGARQRALLALLLLHANEVVSSDRLIDELWGQGAGKGSAKALSVAVARLRKALDAAEPRGGDRGLIVTRPPGYELRLSAGQLDLRRFEQLAADARASGGPAGTAERLREALGLWRGPPLADLAYESFAQRHVARLEELRLAALEDRLQADLDLLRHAELVGELEGLVAEHPLRERLSGLLMLALYRSGRQAEALAAYRVARSALTDELGLEPSRELRELHQAILEQDPALDPPPESTPPRAHTPSAVPAASPFIGRAPELAQLVGGLDDAFAGRGRLFLLVGEPGIGKSRLAEELVGHARERRARVLVGRCWEAGGAPAFWPWLQALREHVHEAEPEELRTQLGAGAGALAQLVPELRERLPSLAEPPTLDPEGARFRLFEAASSFLQNAARARPLVLVLDDLHAADEPSLLLLRFFARDIATSRVLLVGACRDVDPAPNDPLRAALAELAREPQAAQLGLGRLTRPEVDEYARAATAVEPSAALVQAIHTGTEGNPLFVAEVVRLLGDGAIGGADAELRIPPGIRAVIGRRVARLSGPCRELLVLASVLGREFGLDAVQRFGAISRDELLDGLDEAMAERVVGSVPGSPSRLRFGHALIRDTLYDELTPGRRLRLHHRAGEALEDVYAADPEPHLAELAHHFFAAGDVGASGKAVAYARRAGDRAATELAYEEAARLYGMALDGLDDGGGGEEARGELLLALGDAQSRAGQGADAKATLLRAAALAKTAALPELLGRAALDYGGRFVWARAMTDDRLVPLLEDALSSLDAADSVLRVQLLSRLAAALRGDLTRDRRERVCDAAIAMARRIGDPAALAYARNAAEAALHAPDTAPRRLQEAAEIVSLAEGIGDRERRFEGHEHAYWASWELGDPVRRAAELTSVVRVANELRQPAQLWEAGCAQTVLALSEGRFSEAAEMIERTAQVGGRALAWSAASARRLQTFVLRREQGRLEGYEAEIRDFGHEFPSPLLHRSILAFTLARPEHAAEAEAIMGELMGHDLSDWHLDEEWLTSISLLGETCRIVGDAEHAGALYELLLPYRSLNAVSVPEFALDSASRPLGILATVMERFEDAERHFEEALAMNRRMGALPGVAHVQREYVRMLAARAGPGDRDRALQLVRSGRSGYRRLGMDAFEAELGELERQLG